VFEVKKPLFSGQVSRIKKAAFQRPGIQNKKSRFSAAFSGIRSSDQRWRALKRGLLLQITNTLPRRRTTLQSRCRCLAVFKEESTFTAGSWNEMGRRKRVSISI
jgi:hypothetical protein